MTDHTFDLVVLGAGSGGYAAALRASQLGMSVGLIEKDKVGGTCLHVGCIPTKALLHAGEVADAARHSEMFGVNATLEGIDLPKVNSYRDAVVTSKHKGLQGLLKARGVTTIEGEGKLTSPTTVQVGADTVTGKHVILATGSYPRTLPGLDIGGKVLTSEQALQLEHVPQSVTSTNEQRQTEWMTYHSLADFLDPNDRTKTVEGYPAPMRATIIAKK